MPEFKTTQQLGQDIDDDINANGINDITGPETNEILQNLRYNLKAKCIEWPLQVGSVTNADIGKLMMINADGVATVYQCTGTPGPSEAAVNTPLGVLMAIVSGGIGLILNDTIIELILAADSDPITDLTDIAHTNLRPASNGKCRRDGGGYFLGIALNAAVPGDTVKILLKIA